MKKKIYILMAVISVLCFMTSCIKPGPKKIELSFDKNTAYFSSSVDLMPISGDQLSEGDAHEKASVVIKGSSASILKLDIEIKDSETDYSGVKLTVDNGSPINFTNNTNIYTSAKAETEKTLEIKIYIEKNAPETLKGKTISFYFVLSCVE